MRIGFVSTRLAGVDGVSLETAKMVKVLEQMGHECFYCAGELDEDGPPGRLVPAMHFNDPVAKALHDEAFRSAHPTPEVFSRIHEEADKLRPELQAFVEEFAIELLISQNANTIPMNLQLGMAIRDLVERIRVPTICHHHDFYWERERYINNGIQDILDDAFPPDLEPIEHVVISTFMARRLHSWRGVNATYLPNVFDFETPPAPMDGYARSFRADMRLSHEDVIVLQPTRIIRRKGIEKAIELVRKLNDSRLILLITGYEGDEPGGYGLWLREEADRAGIRYRFIADWIGVKRGERDGHRLYSLWDVYPNANFITYPSIYEGFGNGLLETIYFGKPFVINTYPAYVADIKPVGIRAVEFDHDITPETASAVRQVLDSPALATEMVEHNYALAKEHFSFRRLRETLDMLLARIRSNR